MGGQSRQERRAVRDHHMKEQGALDWTGLHGCCCCSHSQSQPPIMIMVGVHDRQLGASSSDAELDVKIYGVRVADAELPAMSPSRLLCT